MSIIASIETRLKQALAPEHLEIVNESHLHAGHQPDFDGGGETHLRIRIVSPKFAGLGRVERHRLVNAELADAIEAGLHALAIEAKAPGE